MEKLWENYGNYHFHIGLFSIFIEFIVILPYGLSFSKGLSFSYWKKKHMIKYDYRIDHRYENIREQHI
jgi:hypothetical protein